MSYDIGLRAGYFLSMKNRRAVVERDVFVGINGTQITAVEPYAQQTAIKMINATQSVVMPGLVNTHTHLAMTLFRGLEDDVIFHKWLFERILPLEQELVDKDFVRIGTELAALECVRFGVTTVADMYFYAEQIADVIDQRGLRAWVSQVITDGEQPEDRVLGRDKAKLFDQFAGRYKGHERVTPTLGPHAPYTVSDDTFRATLKLAEKYQAPIQTHLSETKREVDEAIKATGKTPVKRLSELGILQHKTLCAHCVHFSDDDVAIFKQAGATMAYNPDSNLKLSSGVARVPFYRNEGIVVGLGTDGAASNNDLSLFGAMDLGTKVQKLVSGDNTAMVAEDALVCATIDGARALRLDDRIGSLEIGKDADLIVVDLNFPHLQPVHDVRSHLVYAVQGLEVDTVICRGRVLLEDKKHVGVDTERIYREAEQLRARIKAAADRLA